MQSRLSKIAYMDIVVIPRVEMAVRSITGSSGHRPNSTVLNPDRRDFIGDPDNTPLKLASSRLDLNIDQDRIDETRDDENFEDGDFPALSTIMTGKRTLLTAKYSFLRGLFGFGFLTLMKQWTVCKQI